MLGKVTLLLQESQGLVTLGDAVIESCYIAHRHDVFPGIPTGLQYGIIECKQMAPGIGQADADGRRLEQQLIAGLAFAEGLLGLASLGDIVGRAVHNRFGYVLCSQGAVEFPNPRLRRTR